MKSTNDENAPGMDPGVTPELVGDSFERGIPKNSGRPVSKEEVTTALIAAFKTHRELKSRNG